MNNYLSERSDQVTHFNTLWQTFDCVNLTLQRTWYKVNEWQMTLCERIKNIVTYIFEYIKTIGRYSSMCMAHSLYQGAPSVTREIIVKNSIDLNAHQISSFPDSFGNPLTVEEITERRSVTLEDYSGPRKCSSDETPAQPINLENITQENNLNHLGEMLGHIGNIYQLTELNLYGKQLSSLPDSFGSLDLLTQLNLSQNSLSSIPNSFGNLNQLTNLSLSCNQLSSLPENFCNLTQLSTLYLCYNELNSLPLNFGNLYKLRELSCTSNQLVALPESFGNLNQLYKLELSQNQLDSLPENIGNLNQVHSIIICENQLSSLPESFGNLNQLTELNLSANQLCSLPDSFGNLNQLRYLTLTFNEFRTIPQCIYHLHELCHVSLDYNPLTEEAIIEMQRITNAEDYNGPRIHFSGMGLEQQINSDGLPDFETSLSEWDDEEVPTQLLNLEDTKQKNNLNLLLSRLKMTSDYSNEQLKPLLQEKVKDFLTWLGTEAILEDKTLAFIIIEQATASCGDLVSLSLNQLLLLKEVSQSDDLSLDQLKDLIIGIKRYELLTEIANEKCATLKAVDVVEVHLCYQIELKDALNLPLDVNSMLYQRISGVTGQDINHAKELILAQTNQSNQMEILLENLIWKNAIEQLPEYENCKVECIGLKNMTLENVPLGKEEDYVEEFKANDKTIWNPYYRITAKLLTGV